MTSSNNNLFLIGMMGSWKSTVGRELAKAMDMEFVDTDDAIEEVTEMKISDIFSEFGEDRFRKMETAFFIEKSKQIGHVFSTGGGIILSSQNREVLQNYGTTFFLNASIETLANRIHNSMKRPLLNGSENVQLRFEQIWGERKIFYKSSAHHTIDTNNLNPAQVLDNILNILKVPFENH